MCVVVIYIVIKDPHLPYIGCYAPDLQFCS